MDDGALRRRRLASHRLSAPAADVEGALERYAAFVRG
jgi:hypothetical protein